MARVTPSPPSQLEAHQIGRKLLKELPARGKYGDNTLNKLAEEFGLTKHQSWVFRWFADSDIGHAPQELKNLLARCRKQSYELTTSFIELLIRVPQTKRRGFERQLVENRWSFQEAKLRVQDLVGKRQGGGRRHAPPADLEGRLRRLENVCASFQRLAEDLVAARKEKALPLGVRQRARKVTAGVSRLREAAARSCRPKATD